MPIFLVCVLSGMLFNLVASHVFPQGIQSRAFWSYFMFCQSQGQVVRVAQPRQSWYLLSPPPPPPPSVVYDGIETLPHGNSKGNTSYITTSKQTRRKEDKTLIATKTYSKAYDDVLKQCGGPLKLASLETRAVVQ